MNPDDGDKFFELRAMLDRITDSTSLATWGTYVKSAVDAGEINGTQRATLASLYKIALGKMRT